MSKTKHEQVLEHIRKLPVSTKVSVRQLARELAISDGTVYRAIKEAENKGLVSSIPKVGTIRIETTEARSLDSLSFHELTYVLEGKILSGFEHSEEVPKSFYVALQAKDLKQKKLNRNTMIITDGAADIIEIALDKKCPVLLAAGHDLPDQWVNAFNHEAILVLASPFETFEVISQINRTLFERVTSRELITIADIMTPDPFYLYNHDQVSDWQDLSQKTGHSRFPVVDGAKHLMGVISPMDLSGASAATFLDDVMTPNPVSVHADELTSYLARLLVWENIEIVPVVDDEDRLIGVVSRQDIIAALQSTQKQPQVGDTIDNMVISGYSLQDKRKDSEVVITGDVTKFMLDEAGFLSMGNIAILATNAAAIAIRMKTNLVTYAQQYAYQQYQSIQEGTTVLLYVRLYLLKDKAYQVAVSFEDAEGHHFGLATMRMNEAEK